MAKLVFGMTARIDPATGDGIIVLAAPRWRARVGSDWQTGIVGLDTLVLFDLRSILILFASGAMVIVIGAFAFARLRRRT